MHLVKSPNAPWNNNIYLLFTRASSKHPMLHDVLQLCLPDLIQNLTQARTIQVRFPIYDPERSINILPDIQPWYTNGNTPWYSMLRDHLIESNIDNVLHDRV